MWPGAAQRSKPDTNNKKLLKKSKITTSFFKKKLDEESLRAMVRTGVKHGTRGDDKMRFVLRDACDEISGMAAKRRAFEDTGKDRSEQGAAGGSRWTNRQPPQKLDQNWP